jgi:hypothetical protein
VSSVAINASGVAANFQRMVRIADATGIPVDNLAIDLIQKMRKGPWLNLIPSTQFINGEPRKGLKGCPVSISRILHNI